METLYKNEFKCYCGHVIKAEVKFEPNQTHQTKDVICTKCLRRHVFTLDRNPQDIVKEGEPITRFPTHVGRDDKDDE